MPATATSRAGSAPGRDGRDLGLDALRGLAALLILLFHVAGAVRYNAYGDAGWLTTRLKVGVPIFFALSGYLLYRQLFRGRPGGGYGRYALRRMARVAPAYWLALLVLAWVPMFGQAGHMLDVLGEERWWVYFAFGQVFSPDTVNHGIPPAWSLTSELLFYLTLPVLALGLAWLRGRTGAHALRVELVVLGAAAAACVLVAHLLGPSRAAHPNLIVTPVMNVLWFLPGMAWAAVESLRPQTWRGTRARGAAALAALIAFAVVCAQPVGRGYEPVSAAVEYVGFAVVAGGLLVALSGLRRATALKPIAAVGTVSFGLYLWHVPILVVARDRGDHAWMAEHTWLPLLAWVLPLSLAAGTLSWFLVEKPVLRLAAGRRARPARAAPQPVRRRRLEPATASSG